MFGLIVTQYEQLWWKSSKCFNLFSATLLDVLFLLYLEFPKKKQKGRKNYIFNIGSNQKFLFHGWYLILPLLNITLSMINISEWNVSTLRTHFPCPMMLSWDKESRCLSIIREHQLTKPFEGFKYLSKFVGTSWQISLKNPMSLSIFSWASKRTKLVWRIQCMNIISCAPAGKSLC